MTNEEMLETSKIRMPFGKHSGKEFSEIPQNYLEWTLRQDWIKDPLKGQLERYLQRKPMQRAIDKENIS